MKKSLSKKWQEMLQLTNVIIALIQLRIMTYVDFTCKKSTTTPPKWYVLNFSIYFCALNTSASTLFLIYFAFMMLNSVKIFFWFGSSILVNFHEGKNVALEIIEKATCPGIETRNNGNSCRKWISCILKWLNNFIVYLRSSKVTIFSMVVWPLHRISENHNIH